MNAKIMEAAKLYIDRQNRTVHPDGKFDNASRWYPSDSERCGCCDAVRSPSRAWPYSYMIHCRTAKHIANLYSVSETELKREARRTLAEAQIATVELIAA